MSRKVDPVHFFNARGHSMLTMDHQGAEIDRLQKENTELKRRLRAAITRLKTLGVVESSNHEKAN